jgi:hypothetical protein
MMNLFADSFALPNQFLKHQQKESGFQGNALRISTGEKAFCTLFTDEHHTETGDRPGCCLRCDTANARY